MLNCDIFVYLDHVQFSKGGYINRTKLEKGWLTMPVTNKDKAINQVLLHQPYKNIDKLSKRIKQGFPKHYKRYKNILNINSCSIFQNDYLQSEDCSPPKYIGPNLADFNIKLIEAHMTETGIPTKTVRSSELDFDKGLKNNLMLVEIIKSLGGKTYLTRNSSYHNPKVFEKSNINVEYFDSMKNSNGLSIITT